MWDDRAFIQAIAANPDADGPRLMFADYLDERGDALSLARAEFIRVQCALADNPTTIVQDRLWDCEQQLLENHWRAWLRPICQALGEPLPMTSGDVKERHRLQWLDTTQQAHMVLQVPVGRENAYFYGGQFRRGFFSHAVLVAKPYRGPQHIARLVERTPLDGLTLIQYPERELRATLAAAVPEQLRSLELLFADTGGLAAVAQLRAFCSLRELVLRSIRYHTDVATILSNHAAFQNLRMLSINSCTVTEEGLEEMLVQPWMARLERLELIHCGLTDRHARLLHQRWPPGLRNADFSGNRLTTSAWRALLARLDAIQMNTPVERPWPERFYR